MKALTLWQPWASFMVALPTPPKTIETRGWGTNYRGPVAIHAAKKEPAHVRDDFFEDPLLRDMLALYLRENASDQFYLRDVWDGLPRGAILGTVDLFDVRPIPIMSEKHGIEIPVDPDEWLLGDYSPGRFAWMTRNAQRIEPIPWKGRQGLWTVPDGVLPVALGRAPTR